MMGKKLYFREIVRNDDVTSLKKSEKQHASELWAILALFGRFGLFKMNPCIPSGIIHAKETPFSAKRKVVNDN